MTLSRHLCRWLAPWGVVLLAFSACSGSAEHADPPPVVRPTAVHPSTSPTASASTTATPLPAAAREHSSAGAQAFAVHYLKRTNEAWMKPDPKVLSGLATSACRTCQNYITTAAGLARDHRRYDRRSLSVLGSAWLPGATMNRVTVSVALRQEAAHIVDAGGHVVESIPPARGASQLDIRWMGDHWYVNAIRLEAS